ncbi:hypothetical protein SISSUDRAFT_1042743 [Sistotremastrum suecicum HHB10207 ss-3]|uniref:Uncharacterized protein n=1 Tax=Sistotremastrum suecicum HHB10207 ss-3 TaxID=1314776 RepID=A0A166GFH6_9AGAM|nr:hypothetical protein SISSUDRAFT_1042743 [Sistotremastrum suecicum HHB10207 ss-3]
MSSEVQHLASQLKTAEEQGDGTFLTDLVGTCLQDHASKSDSGLENIAKAIVVADVSSCLDSLVLVPMLLISCHPQSAEFLKLLARRASPKEVTLTVQESLEQMHSKMNNELDDSSEDPGWIDLQVSHLISLIDMYGEAIPRLRPRKNILSPTLTPLFTDLRRIIVDISVHLEVAQGRALVRSVSRMVASVHVWVTQRGSSDPKDLSDSKSMLVGLVLTTLEACQYQIQSCLAIRTFQRLYPKIAFNMRPAEGWQDGDSMITEVAENLALIRANTSSELRLGDLIIGSHVPDYQKVGKWRGPDFLAVTASALASNIATDESLAMLLMSCNEMLQQNEPMSPMASSQILQYLAAMASLDPDPSMRLITFRLMSMILTLTPTVDRLHILADLIEQFPAPQMRVSAINLTKEAVLQALDDPSPSLFASSDFFRSLGPKIFRHEILGPENSSTTQEEFCESAEPARVTECLSLYFIMLRRDRDDRTGVRNPDTRQLIESRFLAPLRIALSEWDNPGSTHHHFSPLAGLRIALQRVDETLSALDVEGK